MAHRLSASQSIKWTTKKVSCPFLRPPSLSFWRNQQKYNYGGELNWGLSASQGWKEGFNKAQRERVCLTDCGKSCVFCRWQWCTFTFTFIHINTPLTAYKAYKHTSHSQDLTRERQRKTSREYAEPYMHFFFTKLNSLDEVKQFLKYKRIKIHWLKKP